MKHRVALVAAAIAALSFQIASPIAASAQTVAQRDVGVPTNAALVTRMIEEGTKRSHAEQDLEYLLDVIGPRLSGSPEMRRANEWTQQKSYRRLIPPAAIQCQRELFVTDMEAILRILLSQDLAQRGSDTTLR